MQYLPEYVSFWVLNFSSASCIEADSYHIKFVILSIHVVGISLAKIEIRRPYFNLDFDYILAKIPILQFGPSNYYSTFINVSNM